MPKNIEYMIAAYGVVSSAVIIYTLVIFIKLGSVRIKLRNLQQAKRHEEE